MRSAPFGLAFIITCLCAAGLAYSATTSRLEGRVVDDQEGPLADVQVTISSDSLIGGPQSMITDDNGAFAFHFLLVGDYTVDAERVGYTPATALVPVRLDRTASVTLAMAPVTFTSEIDVDAEIPIVDTTQTNISEVFGVEYLQQTSIGSSGRFYVRVMDQAAGVNPSESNPEVFGATWSENSYLVNGLNTTSGSTGEWNKVFPFDAVEETSVLTGGLDAEFGHVTGGVLNLVTKSGGNRFFGTFDARFRDQQFNESGEHYDPDLNVGSDRVLSATLGGPILRDRLWFFAAFENQNRETTPVGAPATSTRQRDVFLGKLTWSINENNRLSLSYNADPSVTEYYGVSRYREPEATNHGEWGGYSSLAELNTVLSESLLLTVGLGFNFTQLDYRPMINSIDTNPEVDANRFVVFSNPMVAEFGEQTRDHHRAKLSWFTGDYFGSHQVDAGLEYHNLRETNTLFTPGGYSLWYYNNDFLDPPWPDGDGDGLVDVQLMRDAPPETARDPLEAKGDGWSAFLQDQWRPASQVTVRFGLRYDTMAHTNTVGETVANFDKWLPRLGLAWDIGGRGRHVLRGGWSRYMHPGVTNFGLLVPGVTRGSEVYLGLDFLCKTRSICDRETAGLAQEFVHVDDDGDEHPFYLYRINAEIPAETVDTLGVGRLRAPYRDEVILAYEARVARETSLELSYVRKVFHDRIDDTCNNNTWAWGDGDPPSLDDPSTWTVENGCTGSVRANIDGLERDYEAFILRAASRARSWFHMLGSYTYSKTRGDSSSSPFTGFATGLIGFPGSDFDYYPTNFVNRDGNLPEDLRHLLKLNGFLQFPLDFTLGIGAAYSTGHPLNVQTTCLNMFNPTPDGLAELERLGIDYDEMLQYCQSIGYGDLFLEPRGSRRGSGWWQLDLQLSKGFSIGAVRLLGIVSVWNVFSKEAPTTFVWDPFNPLGWGTPTAWQQPRRWELGLRLEF